MADTPVFPNIAGWKFHHECRCISYWNRWMFIAMLVYRRVTGGISPEPYRGPISPRKKKLDPVRHLLRFQRGENFFFQDTLTGEEESTGAHIFHSVGGCSTPVALTWLAMENGPEMSRCMDPIEHDDFPASYVSLQRVKADFWRDEVTPTYCWNILSFPLFSEGVVSSKHLDELEKNDNRVGCWMFGMSREETT